MSVLKTEFLEQYIASGSRRNFLAVASKVAGLGAASMAMNAQSTSGPGLSAASDLNVLNFALTLEFLEASFYVQFLGAGSLPAGVTSITGLTGTVTGNPRAFTVGDLSGATGFQGLPALFSAGLFSLLTQIRDHEIAHVAALIQTIKSLGGTPTQPCTYTFPVTDINSFLKTAQALENTGVSAYDGAINMISNPTLIQTGASIATVEARHASFLNLIAGGGLSTGNFQPGSTTTGGATAGGATAGGATGGTTTGGATGGTTAGGTTGGTTTGGTTTGGTTTGGNTTGGATGGTTTGGTTTGGTTTGGAVAGGALAGGTASAGASSPTIPGVSPSPFPNAFDTPLSMAQVVQIAAPFLGSCPIPLQVTSLAVTITPVASSTSPFTASQVTLDLSNSVSGTSQPVKFAFSVPPNVSAFCPATSGGTSISGSTGSTGTTSSGSITGSGSTGTTGSGSSGTTSSTTTTGSTGTTDLTGTGASATANATCPLKPAILTSPNSPKAVIQFVAGSGFYPVQVSVTDSTGRVATQIIVLAYQAAGGLSLPVGTPGMTMVMPSGSNGTTPGTTGTGGIGTGSGSGSGSGN